MSDGTAVDTALFDVVIGTTLTATTITVKTGISDSKSGTYSLRIRETDLKSSSNYVDSVVEVTIVTVAACSASAFTFPDAGPAV